MKRPSSTYNVENGVLCAEQFQIAYATNDIERATAYFKNHYGIQNFTSLDGSLPEGGQISIRLAWLGNTMYELLTASGTGSEVFVGQLPLGEFVVQQHHLGFLIHNNAEWDALMRHIEQQNWKVPYISHTAGFMQNCFIEAPPLGVYLEYLFPEQAGLDFFENVAAN